MGAWSGLCSPGVSPATSRARAPLIGRAREIEQLLTLIEDEEGGLAVVSGEAGIGKTRLLEELTERAAEVGRLTLVGRAAEYERELPFGLVIDAVDPFLESLDSQAYERLARDRVGELASVFPALHGLGEAVREPATATERFRIHNAVRELLERLAARQPILFVLEDLHWADGASLELITHLVRRPPQAAVTLALSFRTGQADPAMLRSIQDRSDGGVVADRATAACGRGLRAPGRSRRARGHRGAAAGERRQPVLPARARAPRRRHGRRERERPVPGHRVPAAVGAAIARELDGLSPGARAVAEAAAVVGDPFEVSLAQAAVEVLGARADERTGRARLRSADPVGGHAAPFRVPPPAGPHRDLRGGAARGRRSPPIGGWPRLLIARGVPASESAHHVERSAQHGDMAAVELLRKAAEQNATRAPTSAARWLAAALELCPITAPDAFRRDLIVGLAGAQAASGDLEEAHAPFEDALRITPADDPIRPKLVLALVGIEHLTGRQIQAKERLETALAELGDDDSEVGVSLKVALTVNGLYLDERDGMYTLGRARHEERREARLAAGLGGGASRVRPRCRVHRPDRGRRAARRTRRRGSWRRSPTRRSVATSTRSGNLAGAELYLDRYLACRDHAERGMRVARATGQGELVALLNPTLGTSLWVLGEFDRSAEILDAAVQGARLTKNAQAITWGAFNRAYGALMSGDVETAYALGEESRGALARLHRRADLLACRRGARGDAARGRRVRARHRRWSWSAPGAPTCTASPPGSWRATYLEVLVLCWLALGREEEAEAAAERVRAQADAVPLPIAEVMAARAEASVALSRGRGRRRGGACARRDREGGDGGLDAPRGHLPRVGRPRAARGRQGEEAAALFERAAGDQEAMGAMRYRDQAEALLRKAGVRRARKSARGRADGRGVETLSGRELEVAEPHSRPADEQGDRRRALPEPQDRGEPRPQHLRKARRFVAGGHRPCTGGPGPEHVTGVRAAVPSSPSSRAIARRRTGAAGATPQPRPRPRSSTRPRDRPRGTRLGGTPAERAVEAAPGGIRRGALGLVVPAV